MFANTTFIKSGARFVAEYTEHAPAPMFRRRFSLGSFQKAEVIVCALGYGVFSINGKRITEDRFTAPVSDYNRTLWYTRYDVTALLREGENCIAAICGNGFFNESFATSWDHNKAAWRDNPKFILNLVVDGRTVLKSDTQWRVYPNPPITYNHLRSGEYFDSRLYDAEWDGVAYDDSAWEQALADATPPKGAFRECLCEPIREFESYKPVRVLQNAAGAHVFDIGQNISGYIRLKIRQASGDVITIRYAEDIHEDATLKDNRMRVHYKDGSPFQTDRFICNGESFTWSPMFCYHGFRYIEITGLSSPDSAEIAGVFVHQAVRPLSGFTCANKRLEKLFEIGQKATLSNLFYMPTDCPTREKLGWANDAQASAEQMLINFDIARLFKKWLQDIYDAMREDGALPGIIPTSGWGYAWGNGPVSDGVLFEIPHMLYLYTGDRQPLEESRPYFKRYIDLIRSMEDGEGSFEYGLNDWAAPEKSGVPLAFICAVLFIKMLRIAELAEGFAGNPGAYAEDIERRVANFKRKYIAEGRCAIDEQTAVAMVITHDLYDDLEPLKQQLAALVEARDFHHNCGMVGLRHLYNALNTCGLADYAYRIITARGYPSYDDWLEGGATTLWELWQGDASLNHHMYSDFMAWIMKTLVGIRIDPAKPGFGAVKIAPAFVAGLDRCAGYRDFPQGRLSVRWERQPDGAIRLEVEIPAGVDAAYGGQALGAGKHAFTVKQSNLEETVP